MRLLLAALAVLAVGIASEASAQSRSRYSWTSPTYSSTYSESSSSTPFLYRGYNPGHIFGNTVRRVFWGPSMRPRR